MSTFTAGEHQILVRLAHAAPPPPATERAIAGIADELRILLPDLDDVTLSRTMLYAAQVTKAFRGTGWENRDNPLGEMTGVFARLAVHLGSLELDTGDQP